MSAIKRSASILWTNIQEQASSRRHRSTYAIVRVYEDVGFAPAKQARGTGKIRGGELVAVVKGEGRRIAFQAWSATEDAQRSMARCCLPIYVVMYLEDFDMGAAVASAERQRDDGRLQDEPALRDNDGLPIRIVL